MVTSSGKWTEYMEHPAWHIAFICWNGCYRFYCKLGSDISSCLWKFQHMFHPNWHLNLHWSVRQMITFFGLKYLLNVSDMKALEAQQWIKILDSLVQGKKQTQRQKSWYELRSSLQKVRTVWRNTEYTVGRWTSFVWGIRQSLLQGEHQES